MTPVEGSVRLANASFGVLGTVDPDRGVHLIPVVFAIDGDRLVVPIDRVKPKRTTSLRRVSNILADGRASLLVDHRSESWDDLWWVRADLDFVGEEDLDGRWASLLGSKYVDYRSADAVSSLLAFHIIRISGWAAGGETPRGQP